jgi:two-component SAPR family response regulator
MSQVQLSLLGTPVVKHGEHTLTFPTRKALALLIYLVVEGGMHPRKTLSESFWPELDAEQPYGLLFSSCVSSLSAPTDQASRLTCWSSAIR